MPSYDNETIDFGSMEVDPDLSEYETTPSDTNSNNNISYTSGKETSVLIVPRVEQQIGTDSKACYLEDDSNREARLWKIARILGYISAALLSILGLFCFVESFRSDSSSVFAFAFSCTLDSAGAVVVIWRSFSTEMPQKSRIRELQAQLLIGSLFWIAAMFILVRAMMYLNDLDAQEEGATVVLYIVLGTGCGLQVFFFVTKTPLAIKLRSPALVADGVNSLAASVLAAMGILVSVAGEYSERLAIMDDLVGVVVSFFIAGYGSFLLYQVWIDHNSSTVFEALPWPCRRRQTTAEENGERKRLLPSTSNVVSA